MEGKGIVDLIERERPGDIFPGINFPPGQQGDGLLYIRQVAAMVPMTKASR